MLKIGNYTIKTPAVCASVIGESIEPMKKNIKRAEKLGSDIIELRLDRLDKDSEWTKLIPKDLPTIITNRSENEGGFFEGREEDRIEILIKAAENGADCIDIEFSASDGLKNRVLDRCEKTGVSTILSFHDFEKVPPINKLLEKVERMEESGCDIAKIIGFGKDADDSVKILDFLVSSMDRVEIPIVAFAMGEVGKFTRITAPILGSPFTYGSVEEKSAPGQLSVSSIGEYLDKFRK